MEERLTPGPASRNCSRCHLIRLVAFNLRECRRLRGVLTGREEEEQEEGVERTKLFGRENIEEVIPSFKVEVNREYRSVVEPSKSIAKR